MFNLSNEEKGKGERLRAPSQSIGCERSRAMEQAKGTAAPCPGRKQQNWGLQTRNAACGRRFVLAAGLLWIGA
jgi:hypothetical protein